MHLMTKNTKNNSYYYAVESFRDGKKTSTRIVKSFGSGAQLAAQGIDDPKRYCTERIAEMNASLKDNRKTVESEFDFSTTLKEEGDYSRSKAINLGWKFAADYFDRLGLPELFCEKAGREKYDVGAITRFVVASRMIAPCSKIRILSALENYYDAPEIRDKNAIYRAIEKVDAISDDIQACVYRNMKDMASLDTSALIVDCTNSFFETPLQDSDVVDQEGNVIEKGLRKYGASKEHRPNPIVQIALFADLNGVPISYSIDSGNTNEQKMVLPLEGRMIRDFNKHSFIYCSDGGLGSFENRFFNTLQNRNYVVTQSLKKTPDDELKLILADKNWNMIGQYETKDGKKTYHEGAAVSLEEFRKICDRKYEGKELTEEERKLLEKDRIYKKYPITRKVDITNLLAQKSSGTVEMEETLFVTFSAKYYLYQRSLLDRQVGRAEELLGKDVDKKKKGPNDVTRLIATTAVTSQGEVADTKVNSMDEKKIEEERRFHGFYALATSLDTDVLEILRINGNRWRIEEIFRIMKNSFDLRPFFSWKETSVNAHVLFVFLATQIYRLMELGLKKKLPDAKVNVNTILETLKNIDVIETHPGLYKSIYTGSKILTGLTELTGLPLNRESYRKKDLDRMFGK